MSESDLTADVRGDDWTRPSVYFVRALGNAAFFYAILTLLPLAPWFRRERDWQDTAVVAVLLGLVDAGPRPRWITRLSARMAGRRD